MGTKLSEVTGRITPRTDTVPIVLDGAAAHEIDQLESQLRKLRGDDDSLAGDDQEARALAEQIAALEQRAKASQTDFTLRSIDAETWANLFTANPPTRDQQKQGFDHDPDSFQVAVVHACLEDPEPESLEAVARFRRTIAPGDWMLLFLKARALNEVPELSVPFSPDAFRILHGSDQKPTTAAPEASLEASSSGE